jgi:anti-anti-sigma regulatory factor
MAVAFDVGTTVTRADIPVLCAGLAESLRGRGGGDVVCDVAGIARPDVATIDALARLRMTARRHGRRLVVTGAGPELLLLLRLVGLLDVLAQAGGQPEEREQAGGVEEVVHRGDPPG